MGIVISGDGDIAQQLVRALHRRHDVVVIEDNRWTRPSASTISTSRSSTVTPRTPAPWTRIMPRSSDAEAFVACSKSDEVNIIAASDRQARWVPCSANYRRSSRARNMSVPSPASPRAMGIWPSTASSGRSTCWLRRDRTHRPGAPGGGCRGLCRRPHLVHGVQGRTAVASDRRAAQAGPAAGCAGGRRPQGR